MRKLLLRCGIAASLAAASLYSVAAQAQATTYTSNSSFDGATVAFSVTTDGTLGALSSGNITAWNVLISDGAGTVDLTSADSAILVTDGLTATATSLLFDFSGDGTFLIEESQIGDSGPFWCAQTVGCYGENAGSIGVSTVYGENPIEFILESGEQVLGTADAAPVPEPAGLAMLGSGVLALGLVRRRRRLA